MSQELGPDKAGEYRNFLSKLTPHYQGNIVNMVNDKHHTRRVYENSNGICFDVNSVVYGIIDLLGMIEVLLNGDSVNSSALRDVVRVDEKYSDYPEVGRISNFLDSVHPMAVCDGVSLSNVGVLDDLTKSEFVLVFNDVDRGFVTRAPHLFRGAYRRDIMVEEVLGMLAIIINIGAIPANNLDSQYKFALASESFLKLLEV